MKNIKPRKIIAAVVLIVAVCLCLSIAAVYHYVHEQELDELQQSALAELERAKGEYDEQSIVLQATSKARAEELAEQFGAELRITEDGRYAKLTLPDGVTIRDVYAEKENRKYIEEMSADYHARISDIEEEERGERLPIRPQYTVSDADYDQQTYLDYLNMSNVWNRYTGNGITVAVIDTGIDTDHPEFAGRISEYSYNATEDKIVKDWLNEDGSYDWSLIEDEQGHGTAVTGVIAANMNSGNVVGIAPRVTIITIKAECDENGTFKRTSDLVFGLYYAIERDVQVVNMSFGTYGENPFAEATQLAYDSDVICVAAAGNDGTTALCYPAADPNVIGVGALGDGWTLAEYSNYGENSDLVAPGTTYTTLMGGAYGTMNGTSLASPIVTGAVALFMQYNPYITFDDVTEVLYASCYDLGSLGNDWDYGFGALDISAFILEERGTVTFDMLTDELENTEALFIRGHALQELPEPERLYAIFDGWYYDDTFTEEVNYYADAFESDLTLYAKWANEDDGVPYTYVILDDGTVEIRSYTGHRRYITIPEKIDGRVVSSIGDFAFSGQERLREVGLPSGLTKIGRYAFQNCANLISIEIPEGVKSIGEYAFSNNTRLSTVAFLGNSKLTTIGNFAFAACGKLEKIELPASLTSVNATAFYGATALHTINVQKENTAFTSIDGVLFNNTGSALIAYPAAHGNSYKLPDTTRIIGDYSFAYARLKGIDLSNVQSIGESAFIYSSLETLTIHDSVTKMGKAAFAYNFNLSFVTIGRGLTEISDGAFANCFALTDIVIPDGILSIGDAAFARSGLENVTFEVNSILTQIGASAFSFCYISEIDIPASVTVIGEGAFAWSEWYKFFNPLKRVGFGENSQLRVIGDEAFAYCTKLEKIDLPKKLETIGNQAFTESGLTASVTIPASVTELGAGAFAGCTWLTHIEVEDANSIYHDINGVVYNHANTEIYAYPSGREGYEYILEPTTVTIMPWAFAGAQYLGTVQMPNTLTLISEYAFAKCISLEWLQIPDNVVQLGRYAFMKTPRLYTVNFNDTSKLARLGYGTFAESGMTYFTVPANVSTMAQGVFEGCRNLYSITFAQNSKLESISAYMFDGCTNLLSITFLPGSALTSIQAHGLEGMDNLISIDFGDAKVTNVDNFAFRFCESLSTLNLPSTVTNIGRYAFYGCKSLSELTIPEPVEHIGSYAFLGTNEIDLYFASDLLPAYLDENWDHGTRGYYVGVTSVMEKGDFKYAILTSGDVAILEYLGSDTHVDLTKLDFGAPITAIGGSAFKDSTVTSIVLPDTLTSIQAEAFQYTALESITIPASVTFIGREAFAHTAIKSLTFAEGSKLTVIEQYAFEKTKNLTSVTLPKSLTTMGTGAFSESGLTTLTFENGIKLIEIPQRAFAETKLTKVALPDSVTLVNHNAFNGVETLKSVSFGNNDGIRLMSNAFYHTGLETLHIPANVTYIGEYCFVALTNLKEFTVDANNPNYTAVDGLLLTKSGRKLIAVPAGRTGSLTVPLSVEEIGFGAFEESKLSEILFHEDANILTFGYRAFFKAENITTITVPASVVSIDYYAFAYCKNLQTVVFSEGNKLKGIYEGAFLGDINLVNITIPDSIVEISDFAFYGCSKIDKLPISKNNAIKGIYDYAFAYTGLKGEFTTPETLIDIGNYAFLGTKLTKVTIPDTNKKQLIIGIGAFEDCNKLTEVTLPFIGASYEDEKISWFGYIFGAGAYSANEAYVPKSLKTVTITEGITTIYTGGFAHCTGLETINVPHSVSALWTDAFRDTTATYELTNTIMCYELWGGTAAESQIGQGICGQIVFAEGVTSVRMYDTNIQSVIIPEGVTDIYFPFCSNLSYISLPSSVTTIPQSCFSSCGNLTTIQLPDTLTEIEEHVFDYSGLTEITLPKNLISIGERAFIGCGNLRRVVNNSSLKLSLGSEDHGMVALYAKYLTDKDGNTYQRDDIADVEYIQTSEGFRFIKENEAYKLVGYTGLESTVTLPKDIFGNEYDIDQFSGAPHVIVPEGITKISDHAFENSRSLISISLPQSVISIGERAFAGCESLKSIQLPENLKHIGSAAFSMCTGITEISIPDSVESIGSFAFYECGSLTSVQLPEGLTELNNTFQNCRSLKTINIPSTVTSLDATFSNCTSLTDVKLPEGLPRIGPGTFYNCSNLKNIQVPNSVTRIEYRAFLGCDSLDKLVIPTGIEYIGMSAFSSNCEIELQGNPNYQMIDGIIYDIPATEIIGVTKNVEQNVVIPEGVTFITDGTFKNCTNLVSITIPETVTSFGFWVFSGCTNLEKVVLPEGITEISPEMFSGCINLKDINIPSSVKKIDWMAFYNCKSLKTIVLPNGIEEMFGAFMDSGLESIVIPESVTRIEGAFDGCQNLTSVTLPDNLSKIDGYTFWGCCALTTITIPSSVTYIDEYAFWDCWYLYEIINNSDLNLTFGSAEHGHVALNARKITDKNGNVSYRNPESKELFIDTPDGFRFIEDDGVYKLIAYLGDKDTITLPESINGNEYEIYYFRGGENVTIPDGVTEISDYAFFGCSSLTRVVIPDSVTAIGLSAFSGCNSLESVVIPDSVTSIGDGAFEGCSSLTSITIPDSVTTIWDGAFSGCSSLTSVVIPDSVGYIGGGVFDNTALYNNPANWRDGMLIIDGWLIDVDESVRYLTNVESLKGATWDAYEGCYLLKNAVWGEQLPSNIETLYITDINSSTWYVKNTLTLKNIVICDSVDASDLRYRPYIFTYYNLTGVTIFVEAAEEDLRWDDNFPGWSNGNRVIYGGNWTYVNFYDENGNLIRTEPRRNAEVIRLPVLDLPEDDHYTYELIGWDLDGDGVADSIPATSIVDINATPIIVRETKKYTVTFKDSVSGEIYKQEEIDYGTVIIPPADPTKEGTSFNGWNGYTEGMTVTGDVVITAKWHQHDLIQHPAQAPTCTEIGWNAYETCSRCDYTTYVELEKMGHDLTQHAAQAPTCTEIGWNAYETCTRCDYTTYVEIPATGHSYGAWYETIAPKCETKGEERRDCANCNHYETRKVAVLGHSYTSTVTAPTCTELGYTTHICHCGDSYIDSYVDATGHSYTSTVTAPTCTEQGYTTHTCTVCGYSYADSYTSATGHNYGAWTQTTAPTCTVKGEERHDCANCDYYETREVAAKGHTYTHTVVPPTTQSEGYTEHTCSVCGDSYKDSYVDRLTYTVGDTDGNEAINKDDAIYLLMATFFPEEYPLDQPCDYDNNGTVNKDDAIYLLMHTFFPQEYPLTSQNRVVYAMVPDLKREED